MVVSNLQALHFALTDHNQCCPDGSGILRQTDGHDLAVFSGAHKPSEGIVQNDTLTDVFIPSCTLVRLGHLLQTASYAATVPQEQSRLLGSPLEVGRLSFIVSGGYAAALPHPFKRDQHTHAHTISNIGLLVATGRASLKSAATAVSRCARSALSTGSCGDSPGAKAQARRTGTFATSRPIFMTSSPTASNQPPLRRRWPFRRR